MTYANIACLDDLTRQKFWPAKEFMYDLVRLPIYYASGQDIACSPRHGQRHNLHPEFDAERFQQLCAGTSGTLDWATCYHRVPDAAAQYLAEHIPDDTLIISYEMTPWLQRVLDERGVHWLDLRVSPLRFASDLYMAVRTNSPALYRRLHAHAATPQAIHYEVMMLTAQVRHRRRYQDDNLEFDGSVVYIGQTEADAALVNAHGRFARIGDFRSKLLETVRGDTLLYRAHPDGGAFADQEHRQIERFIGRPIRRCDQETYELLAGDAAVRLVGLSSGTLQEAEWFGREATAMMEPVCRPGFGEDFDGTAFLQIPSNVFMSEPLWADLVADGARRRGAVVIPPRQNLLRELHNAWWGWSSNAIRHSHFYRQVMDFHGGAMRDDIAAQKKELETARRDIDLLRRELAQARAAIADLSRQRSAA